MQTNLTITQASQLRNFETIFNQLAKQLGEVITYEQVKNINYEIIEGIMTMSNSFIFIYDMRLGYTYVSKSFFEIFGYPPEMLSFQFTITNVHPDDTESIIKATEFFHQYIYTISPEKRKQVYASNAYRGKRFNGEYAYMLFKTMILEMDEHGNVLSILSMGTDISSLKRDEKEPFILSIQQKKEPPTMYVLDENKNAVMQENYFGKRDFEILKLLAQNKSSKEIGNILFISPHTVDTHRRKLLDKMNVNDTASAVVYATMLGWI